MKLREPTQCHLWSLEEPVEARETMEVVEELVKDSHLSRSLLRCRECGQLYFYEFYEIVDWVNGNDPQYTTYIPTTMEEVADLAAMSIWDLLKCTPRIQRDWPRDADKPRVRWVRD